MAEKEDSSDSDGPVIDDNVIRIQLRKPSQRKWELRTRNLSPSIRFPTIQLFDSEGNLLVETNDENISIKSHDSSEPSLKTSQSLNEKDYKHVINKKIIRKRNSISGDKVYTRVFNNPVVINKNYETKRPSLIIKDSSGVTNIPSKLTVNNFSNFLANSLDTTPFHSEGPSEVSSYKSSDNETYEDLTSNDKLSNCKSTQLDNGIDSTQISEPTSSVSLDEPSESNNEIVNREENKCTGLQTSQSLNDATLSQQPREYQYHTLPRSKSNVFYKHPPNKVSFLNTYLRSLPARPSSNTDWFTSHLRQTTASPQNSCEGTKKRLPPIFCLENSDRNCKINENNTTDNDVTNLPTDDAADCEMKKRLKMYRRGISEIVPWYGNEPVFTRKRRHSVSGAVRIKSSSSSESVDEADVVLNRLKRRILKNKLREKRRSGGAKTFLRKYFILY